MIFYTLLKLDQKNMNIFKRKSKLETLKIAIIHNSILHSISIISVIFIIIVFIPLIFYISKISLWSALLILMSEMGFIVLLKDSLIVYFKSNNNTNTNIMQDINLIQQEMLNVLNDEDDI